MGFLETILMEKFEEMLGFWFGLFLICGFAWLVFFLWICSFVILLLSILTEFSDNDNWERFLLTWLVVMSQVWSMEKSLHSLYLIEWLLGGLWGSQCQWVGLFTMKLSKARESDYCVLHCFCKTDLSPELNSMCWFQAVSLTFDNGGFQTLFT